jgi:hypothetical protein
VVIYIHIRAAQLPVLLPVLLLPVLLLPVLLLPVLLPVLPRCDLPLTGRITPFNKPQHQTYSYVLDR